MDTYFGTYQKFDTASKKDSGILLGADNLVGDIYSIVIEIDGDIHKAWLVSRFEQKIGYFDPSFSRKLSIYRAQGMNLCAVLSYVAYTELPDPGHYWGEAAVFGYNPAYEDDFVPFIEQIAKRMQDNVRTKIDLSGDTVQKIINTHGEWIPEQTVPMPKMEKGSVIMKRRRSLSEKAIEQGRKGNKGCYIVSWIFLLAIVTLIIWGIHLLGIF